MITISKELKKVINASIEDQLCDLETCDLDLMQDKKFATVLTRLIPKGGMGGEDNDSLCKLLTGHGYEVSGEITVLSLGQFNKLIGSFNINFDNPKRVTIRNPEIITAKEAKERWLDC